MQRLAPEEVQAAFRLLGLASDEDRERFTRFATQPAQEIQEFTRIDIVSKPQEKAHAELA